MTTAAYPLRARVGLALGAAALRERPRPGGQSDATVREAWFFGAAAAPAEYTLASTLGAVSLESTLDVPFDVECAATLAAVTLAATAEFAVAAVPVLVMRGSGRGRGRMRF